MVPLEPTGFTTLVLEESLGKSLGKLGNARSTSVLAIVINELSTYRNEVAAHFIGHHGAVRACRAFRGRSSTDSRQSEENKRQNA